MCRFVINSQLSGAELDFVVQSTRVLHTTEGESLYEEGDASEMLYLVHSGTYAAVCRGANGVEWTARSYAALENFGASEMLLDHPVARTCAVRVLSSGVLWGVPRRVVEMKLRLIPPPLRKATAPLVEFCRRHVMLFARLSRERLQQLMRAARTVELPPGATLCQQGDTAREVSSSGVAGTAPCRHPLAPTLDALDSLARHRSTWSEQAASTRRRRARASR